MESSKQKLRQELKSAREGMTSEEVITKSRAIADKLIGAVDWAEVKKMHIYSAIPCWNEVETGRILEFVHERWPRILVSIPTASRGQELPKQKFDLIIVPCLGFDEDLYRLGLGVGFYDRLLAAQPKAAKIGLAFADSLVKPGLPRGLHDIPLDSIITEEGIIKAHDS